MKIIDQEGLNYKNTTIENIKELSSYALYFAQLIRYIQGELKKHIELVIIKDHLYKKQNAAPTPTLGCKSIDGKLDKATALYIPKEGELKNNIFLITPFGAIKVARILINDFNQETFESTLEKLNLEQGGEYFFARNDYLGQQIARPATFEDIKIDLNSLVNEESNKQCLVMFEKILSEASSINNDFINSQHDDAPIGQNECFNMELLNPYIPTSEAISKFVSWTVIPVVVASTAIYYFLENKNNIKLGVVQKELDDSKDALKVVQKKLDDSNNFFQELLVEECFNQLKAEEDNSEVSYWFSEICIKIIGLLQGEVDEVI